MSSAHKTGLGWYQRGTRRSAGSHYRTTGCTSEVQAVQRRYRATCTHGRTFKRNLSAVQAYTAGTVLVYCGGGTGVPRQHKRAKSTFFVRGARGHHGAVQGSTRHYCRSFFSVKATSQEGYGRVPGANCSDSRYG